MKTCPRPKYDNHSGGSSATTSRKQRGHAVEWRASLKFADCNEISRERCHTLTSRSCSCSSVIARGSMPTSASSGKLLGSRIILSKTIQHSVKYLSMIKLPATENAKREQMLQ
eukprot:1957479-Rhodomonas_salina.1